MHNLHLFHKQWHDVLYDEVKKPYFLKLCNFIASERLSGAEIYPCEENIFAAFNKTDIHSINTVIIGQDPYHGPNQANGLSFSVPIETRIPPSLKNIFIELYNDLGIINKTHGCLNKWAEQGILLLNTSLTVRRGSPGSHSGQGWETFTDAIIKLLCSQKNPIIFVLWGKFAQHKIPMIEKIGNGKHFILKSAHPSPFSARHGFFGCCHFSKVNNLLKQQNKKIINWSLYE